MATGKKTAIVTGGAGGIGSAFTKRLIQRGYRVVLADWNKQLGAEVQAELGEDILFVYCDVTSWESQAAMFKKACEWGGHIDLFIANAGIEEREHFYQIPDQNGEPIKPNTAVIDINLYSTIYGLRLFRHYNQKSKREGEFSRMFITTSLAGLYPFPAAPIYSVAKHGLIGLVRSTSFKLRRDESILINAVAPGPVDTPISEITKKFVPAEKFTPMKLLVESLDKIIDEDFTGRVIECSNKDISLFEFADFSNENSRFLIEDMTRF